MRLKPTATPLHYAVASVSGLIVGFVAGTWLARHVDGKLFRWAALVLNVVAGVMPWGR